MTEAERKQRQRAGLADKRPSPFRDKGPVPKSKSVPKLQRDPRDVEINDLKQEIDDLEGRNRALERMLRKDAVSIAPADHWALFVKAAAPLLRALKKEGKASAATASPHSVAILTEQFTRLIEHWPDLPLTVKQRLADPKNTSMSAVLSGAMQTLKLGRWSEDD
jgi:hypothetical protein